MPAAQAITTSGSIMAPTVAAELVFASVTTIEGEPAPRRIEYAFPGLSGAGSVQLGRGPIAIVWGIDAYAITIANLTAFELRFNGLRGKTLQLLSETGREWQNVEFIRLAKLEREQRCQIAPAQFSGFPVSGWAIRYRAEFRWMQPG